MSNKILSAKIVACKTEKSCNDCLYKNCWLTNRKLIGKIVNVVYLKTDSTNKIYRIVDRQDIGAEQIYEHNLDFLPQEDKFIKFIKKYVIKQK